MSGLPLVEKRNIRAIRGYKALAYVPFKRNIGNIGLLGTIGGDFEALLKAILGGFWGLSRLGL